MVARYWFGFALGIVSIACNAPGASEALVLGGPSAVAAAVDQAQCIDNRTPGDPATDLMSPSRQLRRMTVALRGDFPTVTELESVLNAADPDAWLAAKADDLLNDAAFYDRMVEFAQRWINLPPLANVNNAPEYGLSQQRWLVQCPEGTVHEGAYHTGYNGSAEEPCNGFDQERDADGNLVPALVADVEPWWAPGTIVRVVGRSAITDPSVGDEDCGHTTATGSPADRYMECGCGPHLLYCHAQDRWQDFIIGNPEGQRRMIWQEPARLFAHLAWHDRPMTDWVLGNYTVGPRRSQAAYVRYGRRTGATELDQFEDWWRTESWDTPTDPHHSTTDPDGWSEFEFSSRNPFFLDARTATFDPTTDPADDLMGVPSAGMLTSLGVLSSWTRERVRGARLLEILACETFEPPPADQVFNQYVDDPATQGPCQHCHARIDPASIHFKRFTRYGNRFALLGVGEWHFPVDRWYEGIYPYGGDPWERIVRLWTPGSRMTPVSQAVADANPETIWIDYLPNDQTLLGQYSDGTIGPLGFGKLIVQSGAFDRCMVRRVHEEIVGRDINPITEAGYLSSLVEAFVDGDRRLRPLIEQVVTSETFRRGL